jgi:hypothetical protein
MHSSPVSAEMTVYGVQTLPSYQTHSRVHYTICEQRVTVYQAGNLEFAAGLDARLSANNSGQQSLKRRIRQQTP